MISPRSSSAHSTLDPNTGERTTVVRTHDEDGIDHNIVTFTVHDPAFVSSVTHDQYGPVVRVEHENNLVYQVAAGELPIEVLPPELARYLVPRE